MDLQGQPKGMFVYHWNFSYFMDFFFFRGDAEKMHQLSQKMIFYELEIISSFLFSCENYCKQEGKSNARGKQEPFPVPVLQQQEIHTTGEFNETQSEVMYSITVEVNMIKS